MCVCVRACLIPEECKAVALVGNNQALHLGDGGAPVVLVQEQLFKIVSYVYSIVSTSCTNPKIPNPEQTQRFWIMVTVLLCVPRAVPAAHVHAPFEAQCAEQPQALLEVHLGWWLVGQPSDMAWHGHVMEPHTRPR